jgi:hypothetical protein
MLKSLDDYIVRAQNGYVSTRHFSVQQDIITSSATSVFAFQITPTILKIEAVLPSGVTGYRLVSGTLTSSASSGTWLLVKKYDLADVTYNGGLSMTYTDSNITMPVKTIGNSLNQTYGPLCYYVKNNASGSSFNMSITCIDDTGNNQVFAHTPSSTVVKNSFYILPTSFRISNITNVTRIAGTNTAGGVLTFCSFELLGVFNNPQGIVNVPTVLNNFLTGNIPLLQENDELYILYYATTPTSAKAWIGEITLVGEEN